VQSALVIAAHGSADPQFAEVVDTVVAEVSQRRPGIEVRAGYLGHGVPLETVADPASVVVPLFLASGFHVRTDIPARTDATVTPAVGPDRRLVDVLVRRLHEAGWRDEQPLVLAAAGSSDDRALADAHQMARDLGDAVGVEVQAAFLGAGDPPLADVGAAAVASYLLAPGHFADAAAECGAAVVAAPLGADPLIAQIILDRYDAARD